ncbi:MAG: amino acid ABC transporter substrate-binding protein [Candidatus Thorarchaeota archaeon]|nr:amino acid ABC transporter substrate-binding protein [Candidatus Thorarchaeota archaeon]
MESGSGKTMVIVTMLVVGLVIGLGIGYMIPGLMAPVEPVVLDDYDIIQDRGTIVVGTNSGWPPFEMINTTTNELEGFDIDLAELVADYLDVTVEWVDMDFDALIGACEVGTIDMVASATFITAARCDVLQPVTWYIRTNEVIVVKSDSVLDIDSLDDLVGYDVGVQTATVEDEELSEIAGIILHRYPLVETMFQDLESGTLDAVYVDEPIVGLYSTVYSIKIIFTVTAPPTAFYIRYGSDRLAAAINSAIAEGFADGTVDALIAKWFG